MIDLHIHTTASADAQHAPAEIVAMSKAIGLSCIAFADHNTIDAVNEGKALAEAIGIGFITGVEINTELDGRDVHLLAYGFDPADVKIVSWMTEIDAKFWDVAKTRVERFNELGLALTLDRVAHHAKGRLPTGSSFLDALAEYDANHSHSLVKPYREGPKAANPYVNFYFDNMCNGGPADVGEAALPLRGAIERVLAIGAVPVLAHPRDLSETQLMEMIDAGLMGVEAYCSYHDEITAAHWRTLADRHRLLVTAGSDFHGKAFKATVELGGISGNEPILAMRLQGQIDKIKQM